MYKFKLPIGDWSGDGHNQCEWFTLESNVPVKKLRELYFETKVKTNTSLDGSDWDKMRKFAPCERYTDCIITKEQIEDLGADPDNYFSEEEDTFTELSSYDFANLFIEYMTTHNEGLILNIIDEDDIPMFPFYGMDEKGRHIGFMGYGLFD